MAMVKSVQEADEISRAQAAEIQGHLNFASASRCQELLSSSSTSLTKQPGK